MIEMRLKPFLGLAEPGGGAQRIDRVGAERDVVALRRDVAGAGLRSMVGTPISLATSFTAMLTPLWMKPNTATAFSFETSRR